ncbi:MAG: hypothetical protein D6813_07770 [Calditrichaeota bacterium]|nr:MAG: hypothetical protein D6813_07770 [Calditrichota bacterium]
MKRLILFYILIYGMLVVPIRAQQGSTAAQFLKIGIDARAAGMGEAVVANVTDVSAIFWNPAGLVHVPRVSFMFSHNDWIADLSHDFIGIAFPLGHSSALGVSFVTLNMGEIEINTIEEPNGTGSFFDASDLAVGITFSRRLTDRFSVGVSAKYVRQSIQNEVANGVSFDIGSYLDVGVSGLHLGMALTNYGTSMKMQGDDLVIPFKPGPAATPIKAQVETLTWPLPTNFRIGIAFELMGPESIFMSSEDSRLVFAADGNHPIDEVERGNFGVEYSWKKTFFIRAGYKYRYSDQGINYGGGIRLNFGKTHLFLDFALSRFDILDNAQRFTFQFQF